MNIDKKAPVMLTGATGYVGGQVAKRLLEAGLTVHAPIRNPENKKKTQHLDVIADKTPGSIHYFKADLLESNSYNSAMQGCELVIHCASPFALTVKDAYRDLIDPAVKGTENVMRSVQQTEFVKRVVLTSSCAAIYGDAKDLEQRQNGIMTEEHWNETSTAKTNPYSYSKTMAEKKAWEMTEDADRFDLVVINPSLVLGPGIGYAPMSESSKTLAQFGDGSMKMGAADLEIGMVDVRDVAEAHFQAAFTPVAKGRHICSAADMTFLKIGEYLRPKFGAHYPLPKKNLPKWLVWLTGPLVGIPRQFVSKNVGYPWKADNSKIKNELGITFRPLQKGIEEHFEQLVENGAFTK